MATQNERSQATRDALLSAARRLFAERGYAEVSVGELAGLAGVTTGALYHQFASKERLFEAVYDAVVKDVSARIVDARESSARPSVLADCQIYLEACVDPAFHRIALVDGPAVMGWHRVLDTAQFMIEGALAAAQSRGEIADLPLAPLARMLAAAMKEAGTMIATSQDPQRARAEATEGARRLIGGLLTERE